MLHVMLRHGHLPVREDDCSYVWQVPAADRCKWIKDTADCQTDTIVQYAEILFCNFASDNKILFVFGLIFIVMWLLYLFLILGTTADNFFCPSLAVIASVMRLSENIAGVTILAFGNGAPDIFTSLVSGAEDEIIMFTELIGAGVFVTAVIAGSVALVRPFRTRLKPLIRDACFYLGAVCWISYVVQDDRVYLWEAISFLLCYLLFIAAVVGMQIYENREESRKGRIPNVPDPDVLRTYLANKDIRSIPQIPTRTRAFGLRTKLDVAIATELERDVAKSGVETSKEIIDENRPKGLFKEFLYDINPVSKGDWTNANWLFKLILIIRAPVMLLLQLLIPVVNPTAEKRGWSKLLNSMQLCITPTISIFLLGLWKTTIGTVSILPIFLVVGTVIGVIVFRITDVNRVPKYHNVFAFLGFAGGMLSVYLVAQEVMGVLECVGYALSMSQAMLGITLLAWGNSVGDLISNTAIAKQGFPRMGHAACFGGPMFNTLLGLGLTYGLLAARSPEKYTDVRTSDMAPGCLAFLSCSLLANLLYFSLTGAIVRRSYGYLMYSIYFAFILIQFLSELHVIHPLGTDHRAPDEDVHH